MFGAHGKARGAFADVEQSPVMFAETSCRICLLESICVVRIQSTISWRERTALAAEQVERHAIRHLRAHRRIAQRQRDLRDVVAVLELWSALFSEVTKFTSQWKLRSAPNAPSTPMLMYQVSTSCAKIRGPTSRASRDPAEVAAGVEVDAEGVVGIERRDRDRVGETAGTRERTDEDRLGRGLVGRLAIVEQPLGVHLHVVGDIVVDAREHGLALRRRQHQVEGAKLKRSAPEKSWKLPVEGSAGFQSGVVVPLFSVTS